MCPSGESIHKRTLQLVPDHCSLKLSLVVHTGQGQKSEGRDGLKSYFITIHNFEKFRIKRVFSICFPNVKGFQVWLTNLTVKEEQIR